jgi:hypothetical protein
MNPARGVDVAHVLTGEMQVGANSFAISPSHDLETSSRLKPLLQFSWQG